MKKLVSFLFVAVAIQLSLRADDYVVTVPAGVTNVIDATFVTNLGSATRLVKRGTGVLQSSALMENYKGEIVVEEGVLLVKETGSLGTSAGYTTVSNGASIVFNVAASNGAKFYGELFRISGDGASGEGGAFVNLGAGLTSACFRYLTLLGDARLRAWGELSIYAGVVNLNGHTLTLVVRNVNSSGQTSWDYSLSFTRSEVKNPGHIVLDAGKLAISGRTLSDGKAIWYGDASNTLTLKSRTRLALSSTQTVLPWTLKAESGSGVFAAGNSDASSADNDAWSGPIELSGSIPFSYLAKQVGTMNLNGPISGTGGMNWSGYTTMHLRGANVFQGLVSVNGLADYGYTPLYVHGGKSLPTEGSGLRLTNGNLPLPGGDFYELPKIDYSNTVDLAISGARTKGGTMASLVKTGSGRLDLAARLTVTGKVELVQGVIRLPDVRSAAAGLIYSCTNSADASDYWYKVYSTTKLCSDVHDVLLSPHFAYEAPLASWQDMAAITVYDGYIWNNTAANKTWSFMTGVESRTKLYINDSTQNEQISYQYAIFKHVTLKPGANKFRFAICHNKGCMGASGRYANYKDFNGTLLPVEGSTDFSWSALNGFGISKTGTDSMKESDYEKAIDAGDGLLFTTTTNLAEMVSYRPAFSNFTGWAGTTLDLNGRNLTMSIPAFSGESTITNGILEIGAQWTLRATELAKGNKMSLEDADLAFGDDAVIDVDDVAALDKSRHVDDPYVIATTDGTFASLPEVGDRLLEKRWRVRLSDDAKSILLYRDPAGMMMILR